MNKRQRKKLFTGYYRVVSQKPIRHIYGIGENVMVVSIKKTDIKGYKIIEFYNQKGGISQEAKVEQLRPIYSKKRPTKGCTQ